MSILDRVTKAVGDVVDRGKKEVDQFVRIQKINSQIGDLEKSIGASRSQIQQAKLKIGEMAIEMLRAGTLASQEMNAFLEQITGIQQQIASRETEISQKRAEIESIKSEDRAAKAPGPVVEEPPAPPSQPAASRFCPQCGVPAGSGTFCAQCGSKLA
jgi:division protein CdvB (Snf7/Vps24/ESCRT-III family)